MRISIYPSIHVTCYFLDKFRFNWKIITGPLLLTLQNEGDTICDPHKIPLNQRHRRTKRIHQETIHRNNRNYPRNHQINPIFW